MRIVSGVYGGRKLQSPKGDSIRPTSDKIRGAIFNSLLGKVDLDGASVLDVFCGSGALGLEALSRGAARCRFIDKARASLNLAHQNADILAVENCDFIKVDASKLGVCDGGKGDLVFMDPPYALGLVTPTLKSLHDGGWLSEGALLVVEVGSGFKDVIPAQYRILQEKTYGKITRIFYLSYQSKA